MLFGSAARGEAGPDSDIDLLVILDDDAPREKLTLAAGYAARQSYRHAADVIPVGNQCSGARAGSRVVWLIRPHRKALSFMSGPDDGANETERRREAARWLAVAMEDARVARACLEMPQPAFGIAAYHRQQAAEKLVKGLLVAAGAGFPRTHDLAELAGRRNPLLSGPDAIAEAIGPLTVWSVAYRYPGIEEDDEPEPDGAALLMGAGDDRQPDVALARWRWGDVIARGDRDFVRRACPVS